MNQQRYEDQLLMTQKGKVMKHYYHQAFKLHHLNFSDIYKWAKHKFIKK